MRGAPDVAASRVGSAESTLTVLCIDGDSLDRAQGLSDRLEAPLAVCEPGCTETAFIPEPGLLYLKVFRDGLSLMRYGMELRPDFAEMLPRIKQGALQREMLVKAARVKGVEAPRAVDATAGLGEDSLLLVSPSCATAWSSVPILPRCCPASNRAPCSERCSSRPPG